MRSLIASALVALAVSSASVRAEDSPRDIGNHLAAQAQPTRADVLMKTLVSQRDAMMGQAQLCEMDVADLRKQIEDLKAKLAEAEKKAADHK